MPKNLFARGDVQKSITTDEDLSCAITCVCGDKVPLWIPGEQIARCPNCGRGYKTELIIWVYEKNENA